MMIKNVTKLEEGGSEIKYAKVRSRRLQFCFHVHRDMIFYLFSFETAFFFFLLANETFNESSF